jgi:hypothetical protein
MCDAANFSFPEKGLPPDASFIPEQLLARIACRMI